MGALWGCLLHNASVRYPALTYLTMRFPLSTIAGAEGRLPITRAEFCPDATGSVLRALLRGSAMTDAWTNCLTFFTLS